MRTHNAKFLVIEDSRSDRLRFRSMFDIRGVSFNFAWDAETSMVPRPDKLLEMIREMKPSRLLLDLAWTTVDDRALESLRFKDTSEVEESPPISGFQLLEKLEKKLACKTIDQLSVIVTTQYIPPVAYGLRKYIQGFDFVIGVIHKWRDEKKLLAMM